MVVHVKQGLIVCPKHNIAWAVGDGGWPVVHRDPIVRVDGHIYAPVESGGQLVLVLLCPNAKQMLLRKQSWEEYILSMGDDVQALGPSIY
jgi:hypothetical protein